MKEERLICKAPLEYLNEDIKTECAICHMHGPEHHIMVGAALLTAYKNAGGDIDLGKRCPFYGTFHGVELFTDKGHR